VDAEGKPGATALELVAVADSAGDVYRLPVVHRGLAMCARCPQGVTDVVEDGCLAGSIAALAEQRQRPVMPGHCSVVVA
jgi:hypothetical protein